MRQADLVIPVAVHDGKNFPKEATQLQFQDFSKYVRIGEGFKKTETYVLFQEEIADLAEKVGRVVAAAPSFQNWTLVTLQASTLGDGKVTVPFKKL